VDEVSATPTSNGYTTRDLLMMILAGQQEARAELAEVKERVAVLETARLIGERVREHDGQIRMMAWGITATLLGVLISNAMQLVLALHPR
jgi:hypothetical protein